MICPKKGELIAIMSEGRVIISFASRLIFLTSANRSSNCGIEVIMAVFDIMPSIASISKAVFVPVVAYFIKGSGL